MMSILWDLCCQRLGWYQSCRISAVGASDSVNPVGFVLSEVRTAVIGADRKKF